MTKKTETLSIQEARKLVLLSQRIPSTVPNISALDATLSVIESLGYIQIDTISVIQRAHHHTIWNRNPLYKTSHIDDLMDNQQIFEYWSHAAAYLPLKDYRFSLPRKYAFASGKENHWYKSNKLLMKSVRSRIVSEGPLMAKDFDDKGKKKEEWQTKPTKQALENLFMQGELMVAYRKKFHKVYDLPERVLPKKVDTTMPSQGEYGRFLITRYLKSNGLGTIPEIAYLMKNTKTLLTDTLKEMTLSGELIQINVGKNMYYTLFSSLELLNKPLSRSKLKILSPFDNLVIQRKRTMKLFDFNYLLECYVPASKRKFGYFVLPILWDGRLVARMDCKADRKSGILHVYLLSLESWLKKIDAFVQAFSKTLESFLLFNECKIVQLHKTNPSFLKEKIQKTIKNGEY